MAYRDPLLQTRSECVAQNERTLARLTANLGEWVSMWDLQKASGSFRVAARIRDLRDQGHVIENKMVARNGIRQSQYRMRL